MARAHRRQRAPVGAAAGTAYPPRPDTGGDYLRHHQLLRRAGMTAPRDTRADRAANATARVLIGVGRTLPYRLRVPAAGRAFRALSGPLGWAARIDENLDHVRPDIAAAERARLKRLVPDNVGRSLIEMYSGEAFLHRTRHLPLEGPGAEALDGARRARRPVVAVTAHYGNYNAARAALIGAGHEMGSLYRPMRNPAFDRHYTQAMEAMGGVMFRQGRRGLGEMIRHLKGGGLVALLQDLWVADGFVMPFLGQPAPTSLSAAEMALRYDALLLTFYGVRRPDGIGFDVRIGPEVPHTEPRAMTAALMADLEEMIAYAPEQWFWVHRRWKPDSEVVQLATMGMGPGV